MTRRTVHYEPDGIPRHATPREIVDAWRATGTSIPEKYALASGWHESAFAVNEVDREPPNEHGEIYVSEGVYQLARLEAVSVGMTGANLLDLGQASEVFARLQSSRLSAILLMANMESPSPDCYPYLAMSHNFGLSATLRTIAAHGLDWSAWVARNPTLTKAIAYFGDAITGGERWTADLES